MLAEGQVLQKWLHSFKRQRRKSYQAMVGNTQRNGIKRLIDYLLSFTQYIDGENPDSMFFKHTSGNRWLCMYIPIGA